MKRSTFLVIAAALALLSGLVFLIAPDQVLYRYGMIVDDAGRLLTRLSGASLIAIGLINWTARRAEDSHALRAILYGNLAMQLLTLVIDASATLSGVANAQGWIAVVLHIVLGGGFAYYVYAKPKET
ncbi:MAG TPA: hypothetical protein VII11_11975 [Bacteroidota bacterium]